MDEFNLFGFGAFSVLLVFFLLFTLTFVPIRLFLLKRKKNLLRSILSEASSILLEVEEKHGKKYLVNQKISQFRSLIPDKIAISRDLSAKELNKEIEEWRSNCDLFRCWELRPGAYFMEDL